eukprot:1161341-Pelagomonas_calceolata.AAC.17
MLPTSIKEKRMPRAEALSTPFSKRNKRKYSMGIRRVASSSQSLISVTGRAIQETRRDGGRKLGY